MASSGLQHAAMSRPFPALRTGVSKFLTNIHYTVTIGNDILQAHFPDFASDVARLVVNTTLGIGGLLDPASALRLEKRDRDWGRRWGMANTQQLISRAAPSRAVRHS